MSNAGRMNLERFLAKAKEQLTPEQVALLRCLYEWADEEEFDIAWNTKYDSYSFCPCLPRAEVARRLFWASTSPRRGPMTIPFAQLYWPHSYYSHPEDRPMEKLEDGCRKRLQKAGIVLQPKAEPKFDVICLGEEEVWDGFVRAMKWYAEGFRRLKQPPAE
jgi:hypothetical protein